MKKQPIYFWLAIAGFTIFVIFHMKYGWNHAQGYPLHELSEGLLLLAAGCYVLEDVIKTAIREL